GAGHRRRLSRAMSEEERRRWNERHRGDGGRPAPPSTFAHLEGLLPREGVAMEVACGRGEASVWLALGGLEVWASDVSPVAIQAARRLADRHGVAELAASRCTTSTRVYRRSLRRPTWSC